MNHRQPEKVEIYQIREVIYEVLKDLQSSKFQDYSICTGLLDSEHTKAMDEIAAKIETILIDHERRQVNL